MMILNMGLILRRDILHVEYHSASIFHWSQIECMMKNSRPETFGIYHNDACELFCSYLLNKENKCDDPYQVLKLQINADITRPMEKEKQTEVEGHKNSESMEPELKNISPPEALKEPKAQDALDALAESSEGCKNEAAVEIITDNTTTPVLRTRKISEIQADSSIITDDEFDIDILSYKA